MVCAIQTIKNQGFTLIELILVILILGIMGITVIPKMTTNEGYAEHAYINEVVNKLRAVQLRTMQFTESSNTCNTVIITSKTLTNDADCDIWDSGSTKVEITKAEVYFDVTQDTEFSFDTWGRPLDCNTPCLIVINGREGNLTVAIESEGFIHVSS